MLNLRKPSMMPVARLASIGTATRGQSLCEVACWLCSVMKLSKASLILKTDAFTKRDASTLHRSRQESRAVTSSPESRLGYLGERLVSFCEAGLFVMVVRHSLPGRSQKGSHLRRVGKLCLKSQVEEALEEVEAKGNLS